jgi:hypothetical protein
MQGFFEYVFGKGLKSGPKLNLNKHGGNRRGIGHQMSNISSSIKIPKNPFKKSYYMKNKGIGQY